MIKTAFASGRAAAFRKFALGPPTQVDQFVADIEQGKDVPPEAATPPMPGHPPALDGSMPLQLPVPQPVPPPGVGSTVAPGLPGDPGPPPPSMGALQG